jgi:hypothetical protein
MGDLVTELSGALVTARTSRYSAWSALVRRGFRSNNRALAAIIRKLDLGVCARPITRWSPLLLAIALTGTGLVFLDGVFTALVLTDLAHPFVVEAMAPSAKVMEIAGIPGFLAVKLIESFFLFAVLDVSRLRGLRGSTFALALIFTVIGVLLVANSLAILLSSPTPLY